MRSITAASTFSDSEIDEIVKNSGEKGIYTTHSESHRPIHVPVFQRYPINVPHPVPVAVPQYVRVSIPQPYPKYTRIEHRIEIPVYRVIPEIIEKPVPYAFEKPYPGTTQNVQDLFRLICWSFLVEVERPFPVQVVKKLEIPVPKPYPVHVIYYKHISEDDPPPTNAKIPSYGAPTKYGSSEYGGEFSPSEHHEYQYSGY